MADVQENRGWRRVLGGLTPLRALTAAGSPLISPTRSPGAPRRSTPTPPPTAGSPARPDSIRARSAEWQERILEYAEAVPEVAGAAALVRASMDGVRWVVKGGNEATRKRIQHRIDQLDKDRAAELLWLSGEVYFAVPVDPGAETPVEELEAPFSLSVAEIKVATDQATQDQRKGPNDEWVDLVEEGSDRPIPFMRVWRPAKGNRWKAASPNKAVMDLLDAMYLAQLVDTATQKSRLIHAGIVFWPTNAKSVPVEPGEQPAPGSRQEMLAEFTKATNAVVDMRNKGLEPTKPFIVMYDPGKGNDATNYKPEMFRIEREDLAEQRQIRVEVDRRRYATAVELPVEAVEGMGGTNHWSAWQIDVDKWKTWFAPIDKLMREQVELRMVKPYGSEYTLETDASELIAKPDQTDVVVKFAQLEQVTPESAVEAIKKNDIEVLVAQDPPQAGPAQGRAPGQPSDFGKGDTDRGGGKFRERP